MSIFSRGCLLRHHPVFPPRTLRLFFPSKSFQRPRFFTTSPLLHVAKKTRPPQAIRQALPKSKPNLIPTKPPSPSTNTLVTQTYQSYATTLAQKPHPTLLYQAPSQTLFILSSYSASGFCFAYAIFSFWANNIDAPVDLATWVPYAFTGISFMMMCFGGWLLLGPARLIRSITAVPKHAHTLSTAALKQGVKNATPELRVEVELRKMFPLPFFPARTITAKPGEIILPLPLCPPPPKPLSATELREKRLYEEHERQKLLEYERSHIMSSPFRHASRALFHMFKAIGRAWSREGFLRVEVNGGQYKLDVSGGWALDGGKGLDRLARLKPKL